MYRIYETEFRLDTPLKFRHPCYEALTWFAAKNILSELKGTIYVHVYMLHSNIIYPLWELYKQYMDDGFKTLYIFIILLYAHQLVVNLYSE